MQSKELVKCSSGLSTYEMEMILTAKRTIEVVEKYLKQLRLDRESNPDLCD